MAQVSQPSTHPKLALHRVERAALVPPRAEPPFPLRAGRASPPQDGGVTRRLAGEWIEVPEAAHSRDGRVATLRLTQWTLPPQPYRVRRVAREAVYLGVAVAHFGHFLTESIHRLWALRDERIDARIPAVFLLPFGIRSPAPYQLEVLDCLGIDRARVRWVSKPVRVSTLWVPELASRLGEPVDPAYVTSQREASRTALGEIAPTGAIYLHKPLEHGRGVTLGAGWLAEVLRDHGVRTVMPERLSVRDQLREVAGATNVVVDQGSALHLLDVLGSVDAPISLLARPDHATALHHFGELRTPDWATRVCSLPVPPPAGVSESTWRFTSLSRFDVNELEPFLRARLGIDLSIDRAALRRAEMRDLDAWQRFGPALYTDEAGVRASVPAWREQLERSG